MGQTLTDLPDPLAHQLQRSQTSAENADDLLAQLAGHEIDRMLAEAGVERLTIDPSTGLDGAPDVHRIPLEGEEALAAAADVSRQLNELFAELNGKLELVENVPPEAVTEEEAEPVEELVVSAEELSQVLGEVSPPVEQVHAEAAADVEAVAERPVDDGADVSAILLADELKEGVQNGSGRLAEVCLKPLVWLNAPMLSLPPVVRDALGKAAIVTLVNAAAVLLYVLIFRG